MKKIAIFALALAAFTTSYAQDDSKFQYRRSSLATIMLDTHDGTLEQKPEIKSTTQNQLPTNTTITTSTSVLSTLTIFQL